MFDPNAENLVTSLKLGDILNITDERVRQLEDKGIFTSVMQGRKKMYDLVPSVQAYIAFRVDKLPSTPDDALAKVQMDLADLRYKAARADKLELELAELKGQMHRSEDVDDITSDMIAKIRGEILALPGRLAVDVAKANTAKMASAVIKREIDEMLNGISDYKYEPEEYAKRVSEREKWLSVKEAETAAKEENKTAKKPKTKAKAAKPSSGRQQASSKSSARSSGHRKT